MNLNTIQINKILAKSNSNSHKNEWNEIKILMTLEYLIILICYNLYKLKFLFLVLIFIWLKIICTDAQHKNVITICNLTQCLSGLLGGIGKLKITSWVFEWVAGGG